jgi:DNA-binding NarL/FixJ family response regulator
VELLGRYSNWTYWIDRTESVLRDVSERSWAPAERGIVRKLSSEEVVVLVERYRAGATMIELAEQFEVHRTTVSAHLRRAGEKTGG